MTPSFEAPAEASDVVRVLAADGSYDPSDAAERYLPLIDVLTDTELETRMLSGLASAGLPEPVLQHRVLRPDGGDAFIDAAYPEERIALEADGWAAHGGRSAFDPDRARANDLTLLGWELYRFTSTMDEHVFGSVVAEAYHRARRNRLVPSRRSRHKPGQSTRS